MAGKTWVTGPDVDVTLYSDDPRTGAEHLSGVIDTGASIICVDSRLAIKLGLTASNRKPVQMADGRVANSTIYTAKVAIPALDFDDFVQICGVDMVYPSRRILIGRSFLRNYIVNYDGPREMFYFHQSNSDPGHYFDHDE